MAIIYIASYMQSCTVYYSAKQHISLTISLYLATLWLYNKINDNSYIYLTVMQ